MLAAEGGMRSPNTHKEDAMTRGYEEWKALQNELITLFHEDRDACRTLAYEARQTAEDPAWKAFWNGYVLWRFEFAPEQATAAFESALAAQPDNPLFLLRLATILYEKQDYDKAEPMTREALERDPSLAFGWSLLGIILTKTGDYDGAEVALRTSIERGETSYPWRGLGDVLRLRERYGEALAMYDKAIALSPHDSGAHHDRALVLLHMGDFAGAAAAYEQNLIREPDHVCQVLILYNLCLACIAWGNTTKTAIWLNRLQAISAGDPDHAETMAGLEQWMRDTMSHMQRLLVGLKRRFLR